MLARATVTGRVRTGEGRHEPRAAAAAVAEACLADTLDAVARCRADVKVLALDGRAGPWLPAGFDVVPQRGVGLGARLSTAWRDTADLTGGGGLQIGMDTPPVTAAELDGPLDLAAPSPALLGP